MCKQVISIPVLISEQDDTVWMEQLDEAARGRMLQKGTTTICYAVRDGDSADD